MQIVTSRTPEHSHDAWVEPNNANPDRTALCAHVRSALANQPFVHADSLRVKAESEPSSWGLAFRGYFSGPLGQRWKYDYQGSIVGFPDQSGSRALVATCNGKPLYSGNDLDSALRTVVDHLQAVYSKRLEDASSRALHSPLEQLSLPPIPTEREHGWWRLRAGELVSMLNPLKFWQGGDRLIMPEADLNSLHSPLESSRHLRSRAQFVTQIVGISTCSVAAVGGVLFGSGVASLEAEAAAIGLGVLACTVPVTMGMAFLCRKLEHSMVRQVLRDTAERVRGGAPNHG